MKTCPFCNEPIKDAKKCPHCLSAISQPRNISSQLKELMANFTATSFSEWISWFLIAFVISMVAVLILNKPWIIFVVIIFILFGRLYNMQPHGFLTICAFLIAAHQLYLQTDTLRDQKKQLLLQDQTVQAQTKALNAQIEQFQLDKRPYLSVEFINYDFRPRKQEKDILFGAFMNFQNRGRLPASNIKPNYLVCDDRSRCDDFRKWHRDFLGGFPDPTFVPSDGTVGPITYTPGISENANLACIGILVAYHGLESDKQYWFKRMDVVRIIRDQNGEPIKYVILERDISWDENKNKEMSALKEPDWLKYRGTIDNK